jgi:hypothetical protein
MKCRSRLLLALAILPTLFDGCAAALKTTGTVGGWYSVVAVQTPFYHYGPQQGNGPDMQLPRDSIMKVIRPSFGYVKVQLQNGQDGYVASEDIKPASAALVAEQLAPPPPPPIEPFPTTVAGRGGEQFDLNSSDPRLIAPPEPLPEASASPERR